MATRGSRAPGHGVRNTVRLTAKMCEGPTPWQQDDFVKKVLLRTCGFMPADIFCLQDSPRSSYFDVTFKNVEECLKMFQAFMGKGKEATLLLLNAEPLFALLQEKEWTLMVHMFNLHVPIVDVLMFLKRYVDGAEWSIDVTDMHRVWTSKRNIQAKLRVDADGNIIHLPSSFVIGTSRGMWCTWGSPECADPAANPGMKWPPARQRSAGTAGRSPQQTTVTTPRTTAKEKRGNPTFIKERGKTRR
ncbi:zinc finger CCHC domain-containing protein 3-like [Heptranchias perlo]|uniref:zinc finger CCHC domain-containing protein 3-like n=1 Tax=Heptranchias perlo TaxID=212740 RepID=UPI0035597780